MRVARVGLALAGNHRQAAVFNRKVPAMLGWFRALLPREDRFFDLFEKHSRTVVGGAEALQKLLEGGEGVEEHCRRIVELEHQADDITREVLTAVRRTFITPFDRGDIKNLITSMDAIDQMHKTAKAVRLFEVREFEPPMREMGALIVECANLVGRRAASAAVDRRERRHADSQLTEDDHASSRAGSTSLHEDRAEGAVPPSTAQPTRWTSSSALRSTASSRKVVDRFDDVANEINGIVIENVSRGRHARSSASGRPDRVALLFDFLNGSARRSQLDRDHRVDPRAAAAICGVLGGLLQLHRLSLLRAACRQHHRHRHHRASVVDASVIFSRAGRRHRLERDHLGTRDSRPAARMR
jgi:uncharacterized protein Yka (UPF0111/DUF47 family)